MKFVFLAIFFMIGNAAGADENKDKFLTVSHFVNDSVFGNIYELAKKYDGRDDLETEYAPALHDLYCEGTIPKFIVKKTVVFNVNNNIKSKQALNKAAHNAFLTSEMAKFFFKNDFLYLSGYGHDLSKYLLHRSYLSDDTMNDRNYISASQYRQFSSKNKQLALDMGLLIKHFTFKIPEELVPTMYGVKDDMFRMDKFGYQNGQFMASEALSFREYIWRYTLIHDTQIKWALKDDGTTVYEINWTPDLFCKYAIPVSSLKTQ